MVAPGSDSMTEIHRGASPLYEWEQVKPTLDRLRLWYFMRIIHGVSTSLCLII